MTWKRKSWPCSVGGAGPGGSRCEDQGWEKQRTVLPGLGQEGVKLAVGGGPGASPAARGVRGGHQAALKWPWGGQGAAAQFGGREGSGAGKGGRTARAAVLRGPAL